MKSFTKQEIPDSTLQAMLERADVGFAREIISLEAGEFNAAYRVLTDTGRYVVKIAPRVDIPVLTYEKGIMETELAAYRMIAEQTTVRIPRVFYQDSSKELLPHNWYVMEFLEGKPMNEAGLNARQRETVFYELGKAMRALHGIRGERFGYPQRGLYGSWAQAYQSMLADILSDASQLGVRVPQREKIERIISRAPSLLSGVEQPTLIHFDIWEGNVFVKDGCFHALIDTERSMWGDPVGDFISLGLFRSVEQNRPLLDGYNEGAEHPLVFNPEIRARMALMQMYLKLIQLIEPVVRYRKGSVGYCSHRLYARIGLKQSVHTLEQALL